MAVSKFIRGPIITKFGELISWKSLAGRKVWSMAFYFLMSTCSGVLMGFWKQENLLGQMASAIFPAPMCVYVSVCVCVCLFVCLRVCIYLYVSVCVGVCMCVCLCKLSCFISHEGGRPADALNARSPVLGFGRARGLAGNQVHSEHGVHP